MGNRDKMATAAMQANKISRPQVRQAEGECYQNVGAQIANASAPSAAEVQLKEAHEVLYKQEEHRRMQADFRQQLHTLGPAYGSMRQQVATMTYQWFKHQGFWPVNWAPQEVSMAAYQSEFGGPEEERTITIPFVEYVRLKKMEKLGLIVTEVAECMEAVRKDDTANELEELADIDVRLDDYKGGFDLAGIAPHAYREKMEKNLARDFRHGKKF